jgi:hypothetical protein
MQTNTKEFSQQEGKVVDRKKLLEERPKVVNIAVVLMFIVLIISIVRFFMFGLEEMSLVPPSGKQPIHSNRLLISFLIGAPGFLMFSVFALMIRNGRNWVRILFIVSIFIAAPLTFSGIFNKVYFNPVSYGIRVVSMVVLLVSAVLLLNRSAVDWFKKVKIERAKKL